MVTGSNVLAESPPVAVAFLGACAQLGPGFHSEDNVCK